MAGATRPGVFYVEEGHFGAGQEGRKLVLKLLHVKGNKRAKSWKEWVWHAPGGKSGRKANPTVLTSGEVCSPAYSSG